MEHGTIRSAMLRSATVADLILKTAILIKLKEEPVGESDIPKMKKTQHDIGMTTITFSTVGRYNLDHEKMALTLHTPGRAFSPTKDRNDRIAMVYEVGPGFDDSVVCIGDLLSFGGYFKGLGNVYFAGLNQSGHLVLEIAHEKNGRAKVPPSISKLFEDPLRSFQKLSDIIGEVHLSAGHEWLGASYFKDAISPLPEQYEYSFMNTINNGFIHELRVSDPLSGNTVSILPSIEDPTRFLQSFLKSRQEELIPVLVMVTLSGEDKPLCWKIAAEIEGYLRMVAFRYCYISSSSRYLPSHDSKTINYGIIFRGPYDKLVGMSTALNSCLDHVFVIGTDYDDYLNTLNGDTDL